MFCIFFFNFLLFIVENNLITTDKPINVLSVVFKSFFYFSCICYLFFLSCLKVKDSGRCQR